MVQHRVTDDGPTPEIPLPIAPMLDLSFQLLFFFVVTYNPIPYIEGQMDLNLPKKQESQGPPQQPDESHKEEEADPPIDLTIVVRTSKNPRTRGMISELATQTAEGKNPLDPNLDEALKQLTQRLEAARRPANEKKDPEKPDLVKVQAEADLKWGEMVKIMDTCEQIGFQVSFIMPKDLR